MGLFTAFIRESFPQTAGRWDAVAAGEAEFGKPATADQIAAIAAAEVEIEHLLAEAKAASEAASALARVTQTLALAKQGRDTAATRLAEVQAATSAVAGLDPEKLNSETDSIWREVAGMESQLLAARRKAEAESKKAELGNSLGGAFAALGM